MKPFTEEEITQFSKIIEGLFQQGISCAHNIDLALTELRQILQLVMESHFIEKAASEMIAHSFSKLEESITANLESTENIYTKSNQWLAFYFGNGLGLQGNPRSSLISSFGPEKAKRQSGH